jgi:membrane protease subunit HflK
MNDPNDPNNPSQESRPHSAQLPPSEPAVEDASSQALSEALRSSFLIIRILMIILVVWFVFSGFFIVDQNQMAVILRLGKPVGDTTEEQLRGPGAHWAFPYPIDEVVRIPVGQTHTVDSTIGWYATTAAMQASGEEPPVRWSLMPGIDGYTITSGGNIIHVQASLEYRITPDGALPYVFNFTQSTNGVTNLLQNILNNSLLHASSHYSAEDALYKDKNGFKDLVRRRVTRAINRYQFGITLNTIYIDTAAPMAVRGAFEQVQQAEQDWSSQINEAEAQAEEMVITARSQAQQIINEGMTRSNQVITSVEADAQSFSKQLPYYREDPQLFKRRLLTEKLESVMTNARDKFYIPTRNDGKTRELRILLNREPQDSSNNETRETANP